MDGNAIERNAALFVPGTSQQDAALFWTGLLALLPLGFSSPSVFLSAVIWFLTGLLWLQTLKGLKRTSSKRSIAAACVAWSVVPAANFLCFPHEEFFPYPAVLLALVLLQDVFLFLPFSRRASVIRSTAVQGMLFLAFLLIFLTVPWSGQKSPWSLVAAALRCALCGYYSCKNEPLLPSRLKQAASYNLFVQTRRYHTAACAILLLLLAQRAWKIGFRTFVLWCIAYFPVVFFSRLLFGLLLRRFSFAPFFFIGAGSQAVAGVLISLEFSQWDALPLSLSSLFAAAGQGMSAMALEQEETLFCRLSTYLDMEHNDFPQSFQNNSYPAALFLFLFFILAGSFFGSAAIRAALNVLTVAFTLLFFLFLCASGWYAVCQPLDCRRFGKLCKFLQTPNDPLKKRLDQELVFPYRRPALFLILRGIVSLFFPVKQKGAENIPSGVPVIFVCNHLEIYGPLITCFHFPVPFRSWILINMLDRDLVVENLWGGVDKVLHWLPMPARRKVPHLIAPVILWVMHAVEHIPVYRGARRDALQTIRLSSEALSCGDSLMLFPENTGAKGESGAYKEEGVSALYTGFANVASYHYNKTGECVTFLPVYVNKKEKTITIGKGFAYDPREKASVEKKRIVQHLHDAIESLSQA